MLLGLEHIHGKGLVHQYLRPRNLMLTKPMKNAEAKDELGTLKISMQVATVLRRTDDDVRHKAPELFSAGVGGLSFKSDIWAAGVLLYEMCALKRPFDGAGDEQTRKNILNAWRGSFKPEPIGAVYSKNLRDFIGYMLMPDPDTVS